MFTKSLFNSSNNISNNNILLFSRKNWVNLHQKYLGKWNDYSWDGGTALEGSTPIGGGGFMPMAASGGGANVGSDSAAAAAAGGEAPKHLAILNDYQQATGRKVDQKAEK
jgi:hypothetical protein